LMLSFPRPVPRSSLLCLSWTR